MTEPTRDRIAAALATFWHEWSYQRRGPQEVTETDLACADALIDAGLGLVPVGLTAAKLREISAWIGGEDSKGRGAVLASELRAWADVLELRETPDG